MKKQFILALIFCTSSSNVYATQDHHVGFGFNYHLDQQSNPGFQAAYQWQFSNTFEIDTRLISSNDIEISNNDADIFGDFHRLTIGGNFIKRYNTELDIKAGTGLGFVFSSANNQLISDSAMAPYVMLGIDYQLTQDMVISFGQFSHFNRDQLGTNHSFFINLSISFGSSSPMFSTNSAKSAPPKRPIEQAVTPQPKFDSSLSVKQVENANKETQTVLADKLWYVQLGAFQSLANAQTTLARIQQQAPKLELITKQSKQYYRVLTAGFNSKQRAEDHANMIKYQYSLSGYVTQLTK
ncbi:SPOR domain-containing protein [Thalassotalea sp. G2M2-11]|uniref:SPOR domain-containing protein n=1 Tax=Thalassotalea sp. G2M2-11 TaxID=2787627 RepID=UPI0019CF89BC|nr:SPOR domain-containing protein [Thalassotalea sp. G2M2-11]